jgi:hypothetical protein
LCCLFGPRVSVSTKCMLLTKPHLTRSPKLVVLIPPTMFTNPFWVVLFGLHRDFGFCWPMPSSAFSAPIWVWLLFNAAGQCDWLLVVNWHCVLANWLTSVMCGWLIANWMNVCYVACARSFFFFHSCPHQPRARVSPRFVVSLHLVRVFWISGYAMLSWCIHAASQTAHIQLG